MSTSGVFGPSSATSTPAGSRRCGESATAFTDEKRSRQTGGSVMITDPEQTYGRSSYIGFRATIKTVGTGPRGSRSLSFEEARDAMRALLAGEVSDAQAGAFLIAMRTKGEEPDELAGLAQALRDAACSREP